MVAFWGELAAYRLYRAASWVAAPLVHMLFYCRRMQGLEHQTRWPERFGRPSCPRPPGQLLWFHAVSLGEGLAALPLITHCFQHHPDYHVLLTTTTTASFQVIKDQLPEGVIYQHGQQMILELKRQGINVALRSKSETIFPSTSFYVVDTLGELRSMYRATPIAVIGGSFAPSLGGHNISEAAAAGCALLTGPHVGHFSHMVMKLLQSDSLSVLQVKGKRELAEAVSLLLGDAEALKARQNAARRAFSLVSEGVIHSVWNLMDAHVLKKGCC